jgi:hypothetical protein
VVRAVRDEIAVVDTRCTADSAFVFPIQPAVAGQNSRRVNALTVLFLRLAFRPWRFRRGRLGLGSGSVWLWLRLWLRLRLREHWLVAAAEGSLRFNAAWPARPAAA